MAANASNDRSLKHWRLESDLDGIVWLYLDRADEKVNSLSSEVLTELGSIISRLEDDKPTGLVLMSAKPKSFIVGADVREFDATDDVDELRRNVREVHELFGRIDELPFPTTVAFEGYCLGGGLELALCFDYRIALDAEHTRIGFPEVNLGIYPGFGGSGRSIRAMGGPGNADHADRQNAAGPAAKGLGLIDQTVDVHGSLRWAARNAILKKKIAQAGADCAGHHLGTGAPVPGRSDAQADRRARRARTTTRHPTSDRCLRGVRRLPRA
jgi:3-hydroxyacyl-CoA dehydrogenase / enoyl-CoA hydratase / 3-hydroxybutyryl-CoA epimerase